MIKQCKILKCAYNSPQTFELESLPCVLTKFICSAKLKVTIYESRLIQTLYRLSVLYQDITRFFKTIENTVVNKSDCFNNISEYVEKYLRKLKHFNNVV